MSIEFTVSDIDMDNLLFALKEVGRSEKGEGYKFYPAAIADSHTPVGGLIRLEGEDGRGYDMGRVNYSIGSFAKPTLVMTTFNNDGELLSKLMALLANDRKLFDARLRSATRRG